MRAPSPAPRAPAAFRLDDPAVTPGEALELDALDPSRSGRSKGGARRSRIGGAACAGALWRSRPAGGLVSLALGLALNSLVRGLFARADWLGWIGLALVALFVAAVIAVVGREALGLLRLTRLAKLRLMPTRSPSEARATKRPRFFARFLRSTPRDPIRRTPVGWSPAISRS